MLFLVVSLPAFSQFGRYPISHGYTVSSGPDYTDLEHWYALKSNALDFHGSDDGTNNGAYSGDSTLMSDTAFYYYAADDDYVALATGENHGSSDVSVMATVKLHAFGANRCVYCNSISDALCFLVGSSGHLILLERLGNYCQTSMTLTLNTEHHIAMAYDQDANTVDFWIDGVKEQESFSATFSAVTQYVGGATTIYSWDGLQQNTSIWNSVLTQDDIDYYYNSGDVKDYGE